MLGHHSQYMRDSRAVAKEALRYAKSLKLAGDGNDIWIFDIDDTLISHLPYFANHGLGTEPINLTSFIEWMNKSKAPALPASLQLYRELLSLGFKIVLLTGRPEEWRMATVTNLKKVGYHTWENLSSNPQECGKYVEKYAVGHKQQYKKDFETVVDQAYSYVTTLNLTQDGKNIWVFDVDETTLSNLPLLAQMGYGDAPALPASPKLYNELLSLGIKVVFLTGRSESLRNATAINLQKEAYTNWEKLILKGSDYPSGVPNVIFKSNERRKLGEID
ncbi:hypothetical protein Pint_29573 [Pistacia integerrima]|uniref:Uncharacterized protein n=1 Tax=Pistacia integerrima TaxID=434235 RepID=A0ACC0WX99_9ROSI|nr:hypothetical protein Pint_29573 [Pistacia integerrima]